MEQKPQFPSKPEDTSPPPIIQKPPKQQISNFVLGLILAIFVLALGVSIWWVFFKASSLPLADEVKQFSQEFAEFEKEFKKAGRNPQISYPQDLEQITHLLEQISRFSK